METLMVIQAGIQCPAWSLKKSHGPSNLGKQNNAESNNCDVLRAWSCIKQDVIANKTVKGFLLIFYDQGSFVINFVQ